MANLCLIGIENHVENAASTLTAASYASSDTVVANLADQRFGKVWRSLYDSNASTWVRLQMSASEYREVGGVAFGNSNLWKSTINTSTGARTATGQWRVRAGDLDFKPRRNPDAIGAKSANLSGSVSAAQSQDPEHPGGTWITCTDNLANDIRFTFPTFGGMTLSSTTNDQKFRVCVRRKASGGTDPTIEIQLWENGGFLTSLSSGTAITSTTGQVVEATFSRSSLSNTTAANLEVKILATAGTTTTVEYNEATEAVLEFTSGGASSVWYDSGWLTPTLPRSLVVPISLYHKFSSSVVPTYIQVDFDCDDHDDGYIEAGYWIVGPALSFAVNVEPGAGWQTNDPSILSRTIGQRVFREQRSKYRSFECSFPLLSESETYATFMDRIDRIAGLTNPFALMFDPDDSSNYHNSAGIGRMASLDPFPIMDDEGNTSRRFRFEEDIA